MSAEESFFRLSGRVCAFRDFTHLSRAEWDGVSKGRRVRFKVAFCMNGVRAHMIEKD
jgi:hypothetical protein